MTVRSALRAPVRAAVRSPIILRKRWTPAALFAQGQQGVWYEPRPEYLYQDAAGTVPVTADGDPVGLMLDLSRGLVLGADIVPAPFALTNGWDEVGSTINGPNSFTTDSSGGVELTTGVSAGTWYEITWDISAAMTTSIRVGTRADIAVSIADGSGVMRYRAPVDGGVYIRNASAGTTTVNSISVRELPGAHARQATSAARPIHSSSAPRQVYDNVDDAMNVTLPAIAAATVAIATPTGADIQYPVDLSSGSYTITESHSGIIIREGELTAAEQQQVTDYLNAQAGV